MPPRRFALLLLTLPAGLPALAEAPGSADPGVFARRSISELQQEAQFAVERQDYAAAVPALVELERRYAESREPKVHEAHQTVLFLLGAGRLQAGDHEAAAQTFGRLLEAYPQAPQRPLATLYLGDARFFLGRWSDAITAYDRLRTAPADLARLDAELRLGFWERFSDCCFARQDWELGGPVFATLAEVAAQPAAPARARERWAKARAYQLQAAIAAGRTEEALQALPAVNRTGGAMRHDLALNLALVRGGDALYEVGRFGEALTFYEQVLPPLVLEAYWAAAVAQLEEEQARLRARPWGTARRLEVESELAVARQRQEQLQQALAGDLAGYATALPYRVARCYLSQRRVFEAFWAFSRVHHSAASADPTGPLAEEALFGCVQAAAGIGRKDRVAEVAAAYLARDDYTRFVADVAEAWVGAERAAGGSPEDLRPLLDRLLDRVRRDPAHRDAGRLVYLVGSTLLAMRSPDLLVSLLAPLLEAGAAGPWGDGLHYWLGLAAIFAGDFSRGLTLLDAVVTAYAEGPYTEDATFRLGVCRFGLQDYAGAREALERFQQRYPASRLASEASALLGDLAAADGRVEEALARYREAEDAGAALDPPHFDYINHAVFQGGRLLGANERWEEMVAWFDGYLQRWGQRGRTCDALYELGRAQAALGRTEDMLEAWYDAIMRFGHDPADHGPDLMLAEYASRHRAATGELPTARLEVALEQAMETENRPLVLRLAYALHAMGGSPAGRQVRVTADDFPRASTAVLVRIAQVECERDPALALAAVQEALARPPVPVVTEEAWHLLGGLRQAAGDCEGALAAYRKAAEAYPHSPRAAQARLREGDLLREEGKFEAAINAYRLVLQTRQWRGPRWAEANFKIGLTHYEAGEFKEAFAFFQRVYVLYGGLTEWSAPAYLHCGLVLEALGQPAEARATYREMLDDEALSATPAADEALRRIAVL